MRASSCKTFEMVADSKSSWMLMRWLTTRPLCSTWRMMVSAKAVFEALFGNVADAGVFILEEAEALFVAGA